MPKGSILSPQLIKEAVHAYLHSPTTNQKLIKVAEEGLNAERTVSVGKEVVTEPDHHARHKFWKDMMTMKGMMEIKVKHEVEHKLTELDRQILEKFFPTVDVKVTATEAEIVPSVQTDKEIVNEKTND